MKLWVLVKEIVACLLSYLTYVLYPKYHIRYTNIPILYCT